MRSPRHPRRRGRRGSTSRSAMARSRIGAARRGSQGKRDGVSVLRVRCAETLSGRRRAAHDVHESGLHRGERGDCHSAAAVSRRRRRGAPGDDPAAADAPAGRVHLGHLSPGRARSEETAMSPFTTWYEFAFSSTTAEPPTSSQLRFDSTDYTLVTKVWVRLVTSSGIDAYYALMNIDPDTDLFVQNKNDHAVIVKFHTTGLAIDKTSYIEIPVVFSSSSGLALNNNQSVLLDIVAHIGTGPDPTPPIPTSPFIRAPWAWPQSVSSVLVAGPAFEPLTLDEGKLRAGLDWTAGDPRDDLMKGFIAAARQKVEADTGLALATQTRLVTFAATDGVMPMPWQTMPLQSITDPAGVLVDWSRYAPNIGARQLLWPTATPAGQWT